MLPFVSAKGAMVYTTALMNYHSELYKVRGGKGRIRAARLAIYKSNEQYFATSTMFDTNQAIKIKHPFLSNSGLGSPREQPLTGMFQSPTSVGFEDGGVQEPLYYNP